MKTEKTYTELFDFNIVALAYLDKHKDQENKLCALLNNFVSKQLRKIFNEYNDEKDTLQLNNCAVDDKTKVILYTESTNEHGQKVRLRQFTVEAELKLKKEIKELNKQKVEVHLRTSEGIEGLIEELTEDEKEAFSGIVIPLLKSE